MSSSSSDDDMIILMTLAIAEAQRLYHESRRVRRSILRNRIAAHLQLFHDYFADVPLYPDYLFRRRFRMRRHLFLRIHDSVVAHDPYFVQKRNNAGTLGLSSLQKITVVLRMLAYGVSGDFMDEYLKIGETTATKCLKSLCHAIMDVFGEEYLRRPNSDDVARLLVEGERRGFPGMLGSLDCMYWIWKNCPTAWHGMYQGHCFQPTIILEAVASYDMWIWHAFIGMPGSHNNINVLQQSNLFADLVEGRAPKTNFEINGVSFTQGYYLTDGIYPTWSTFVKIIPSPRRAANKYFAQQQESTRKDVERAFGVLQARFAIIRGPTRYWDPDDLTQIMMACIIMHNMIVEDERELYITDFDYEQIESVPPIEVISNENENFDQFVDRHLQLRNEAAHCILQAELVKHLWNHYSDNYSG